MPITGNSILCISTSLCAWLIFVERALEAITTTGPPYVCCAASFAFASATQESKVTSPLAARQFPAKDSTAMIIVVVVVGSEDACNG